MCSPTPENKPRDSILTFTRTDTNQISFFHEYALAAACYHYYYYHYYIPIILTIHRHEQTHSGTANSTICTKSTHESHRTEGAGTKIIFPLTVLSFYSPLSLSLLRSLGDWLSDTLPMIRADRSASVHQLQSRFSLSLAGRRRVRATRIADVSRVSRDERKLLISGPTRF